MEAGELVKGAACIAETGEDFFGVGKQSIAGIGEHHAFGGAVKEDLPEVFFQARKLCADGGLGEVKACGGAGHVAFFGQDDEGSKQSDVHGFIRGRGERGCGEEGEFADRYI